MSLLTVHDGPSPLTRLVAALGATLVKEAKTAVPTVIYNLAGTLYRSSSGWILLSVPNALVRGVFATMHEPGTELPSHEDGGLEAHISVMSADEVEALGGADKITERGKQFMYTLGRLKAVEVDDWEDVDRAYYVSVHSPELQALRRSYGLSSLPHDGEYEFHITVAVRRRGILARNEKSKAS